jgi:hypothetical protein
VLRRGHDREQEELVRSPASGPGLVLPVVRLTSAAPESDVRPACGSACIAPVVAAKELPGPAAQLPTWPKPASPVRAAASLVDYREQARPIEAWAQEPASADACRAGRLNDDPTTWHAFLQCYATL